MTEFKLTETPEETRLNKHGLANAPFRAQRAAVVWEDM